MKQPATRRHKRKLERVEERKVNRTDRRKARDDKRAARKTKWQKRRATLARNRALIATIAAVVLSIGVAIPAQLEWFLIRLAGGRWQFPGAVGAVGATFLIEGLCWLGALLYADAAGSSPVRMYRLVTVVFATIAAAINYSHGLLVGPIVGIVYAVASLMGVGAWELYMHRTRHAATGMDLTEIRLWALRWRRHPRVMREVGRIRATHGLAVSRETAWRMAYLRKIGNPTVPVAITSALVTRLIGNSSSSEKTSTAELKAERVVEAEPSAGSPKTELGLGVDVLEHPVAWADATVTDDLLERFWVEPETEQSLTSRSAPTATTSSPRVPSTKTPEQGVTSAVPGRKRNSLLTRGGTGKVQFAPTRTELNGPDNAKDRMLRYFARAEQRGNSIDTLDRNYIAEQFQVTTKYVRNTLSNYINLKGK